MKYLIKTQGLMCGHCEAAVEGALNKVLGVTDAEANHESNTVIVETTSSVEPQRLSDVVTSAGDSYKVLSITEA